MIKIVGFIIEIIVISIICIERICIIIFVKGICVIICFFFYIVFDMGNCLLVIYCKDGLLFYFYVYYNLFY